MTEQDVYLREVLAKYNKKTFKMKDVVQRIATPSGRYFVEHYRVYVNLENKFRLLLNGRWEEA